MYCVSHVLIGLKLFLILISCFSKYICFLLFSYWQFLKGIQFQRLAPRAYGACGRLIVVEHGGQLLSNYMDNSFSERAELAMQLMSLVQVLWVCNNNNNNNNYDNYIACLT